jgi:hypothetical protein
MIIYVLSEKFTRVLVCREWGACAASKGVSLECTLLYKKMCVVWLWNSQDYCWNSFLILLAYLCM